MEKIADKIKVGQTKVNVFRKAKDERNGKETISKIHTGVVIALGSHFMRVYNNAPTNAGGDASPQSAEWFPISAPCSWIELGGELKTPMVIPAGI